jgi:predicted transcriptional regulator
MPKRTDISIHPDNRRRADHHRAGVRVRLFGHAGGEGSQGRGLSHHSGQFQPGDDHDRSGHGGRDLCRADHARGCRQDHRRRSAPDALLPTMGGQTALNTALALFNGWHAGQIWRRDDRCDAEAIDKAEDRQRFRDAMDKIGLESARSGMAHSVEEALARFWSARACHRSSAPALPWAAPAAALPITRKNSSRS